MNWITDCKKSSADIAAPRSQIEKTSKPARDCGTQDERDKHRGDSIVSGLDVFGTAVLTGGLVSVLARFNENGMWSLAERFPVSLMNKAKLRVCQFRLTWYRQVCDTSTETWLAPLLRSALIPESMQRLAKSAISCDALIVELFLLESLLWSRFVSIFSRIGQKQYLGVVGFTIFATLCSRIVVNDPATLFLVVVPLWVDLAAIACFVVSRVSSRGLGLAF